MNHNHFKSTTEEEFCEDCSGYGTCRTYGCSCVFGFLGDNCEIPPPTRVLTSGQNVRDLRVEEQEMMYFKIGGTVGAVQNWEIHQSSSSQDCDLYLRFGKYPTYESYSYSDTSINKDFKIKVVCPETGEFYGGVYGFSACDFSITVNTL